MMKNKIFGMASITFIAVLAAINVNFTSLENDHVDLASLSLISTANAEDGGPNEWYDWLSYGLRKNERELQENCYAYENWYGGVSYGTASATAGQTRSLANGRTDIRCAYGQTNCKRVWC